MVQSIVDGGEEDTREYPWLGVIAGTIVLFSGPESGTVIGVDEDNDEYVVGEHGDDWDIDLFDEFGGAVTLANDGVEIVEDDCE